MGRKGGLLEEAVSIASISMKVMGLDEGLTSDTALVELVYDGGEPKSAPKACVIKLPEKNTKMPLEKIHLMFQTEIDIYRHMSADFASKGMMLPRLYFAACPEDPSTEGYALVLEHMTHPSRQPSLQVGSIRDGVPLECALLAVKELAGLHAAYWGMTHEAVRAAEAAPGKPKFPQKAYTHVLDEGFKTTVVTGLKHFVTVTANVFGTDGTAKLATDDAAVEGFRNIGAVMSGLEPVVTRRLGVFLQRLLACPLALTHGDSHAENLFLRAGDDPAAVWFDFGTFAFRPAVWDVALFLIASLEPEARASNEENLVKCYSEALEAKGIEKYPFEQCLSDYRFCTCAGFFNIGAMLAARKEAVADEKFPFRAKANILTKRLAAAFETARWGDFFKDGAEDSEEQHPLEPRKPLNFG